MAHIERRTTSSGAVRYEVRWRPAPGERERSKSFPTFEAAKAWKVQVEAAQLQGQRLDPRAGKRLFGDYAPEWLASRHLADQTRELYRSQLRTHIGPAFNDVQLARITPAAVRRWHTGLAARGGLVAPKCYRLLNTIMKSAVEDGLIGSNPCNIKNAGTEQSLERPYVEPSVVFELVAACPPRMRAMVLVAAFGGLRIGELRALRLRNFNEVAGKITVEESVDQKRRRKRPKSKAGERTITLPPVVVQAVAQHVAEFCAGDPTSPLFPGEHGREISADYVKTYWTTARAQLGLEGVHFHDLRHTAGTLSAQAGATLRELMSRIGHSTPRAAMRYQHAADDRDRQLAEKMGDLMAPRDPRGMNPPTAASPLDRKSR